MKNQNIPTDIDTKTQEETASSVSVDFPYRTDDCVFSKELGFFFPWHWHNDVELFYIKKGELQYLLPNGKYDFKTGDIGFINANVLHATQVTNHKLCVQQEHIFLPSLLSGVLGSAIDRKYIQPLIKAQSAQIITIPSSHLDSQKMRTLMDRAFSAFGKQETGFEIEIRESMSKLWLLFLKNVTDFTQAEKTNENDDRRIKSMLRFIEKNYADNLTLEQIAEQAFISSREANRCFNRQLGTSVFEYIIDLRIRHAQEQLRDTTQSITQIALNCGFSTTSYFGKIFQKKTGMTPSEYRKK